MKRRRLLTLLPVLVLALCPLLASAAAPDATLTITINGTLGPVLSGSDPLGANGESGSITIMISESASPTSTTAASATYKVPAGGVVAVIGSTTYPSTSPSTMKITFPAAGPDVITVTSVVSVGGLNATVVGVASLAKGSFRKAAILKHPTTFSPSPQNLTAATSANGPGSKVSYSNPLFGKTVLGLTGTAASVSAADPVLPDDEAN